MELRVLRYFLEVAREKSMTRAAVSLHVSQPTLSKQLKELEDELGRKLFVRSNYGINLTDEGMLLRKRAEDILDMADKTAEEFRALDDIAGGDIRIGCAESDSIKHLARCFKALNERCPNVRYHLYSGDTEEVASRLDRGLLDFAIVAQDVNLSRYNHLAVPDPDVWGVVMRKDDPLAAKEAIRVDDLLDLPLICSRQALTEDLPAWFGEKLDQVNIAATINLVYNATVMVREGLGYALSFDKLANTGADSDLCFRPLEPALRTGMNIVWKQYQQFTPIARLLLDEMTSRYAPAR
ncbi:LysR family transcriptional regulator [Gordonibacter sp. 28C]|uniref:LysR family transcriptional regulator n=1 Tax=Gordonibacter sp. 28C TaxID=2078569 RepID=UPI000DF7F934|nr:LysR family transcriptional regulator [Gordonibacter sp. 28C]RDB62263.1 LysR family transcriptional regulator [Gordonibacter sp. 28C]